MTMAPDFSTCRTLDEIIAVSIRYEASQLEKLSRQKDSEEIADTRERLLDMAEAIETGRTVEEVKRLRFRKEGKPLLSLV